MMWDDRLRATVDAHHARLLRDAAVSRLVADAHRESRWPAAVSRLYLRLWWATRPRRSSLHCLVSTDHGLAMLSDGGTRA